MDNSLDRGSSHNTQTSHNHSFWDNLPLSPAAADGTGVEMLTMFASHTQASPKDTGCCSGWIMITQKVQSILDMRASHWLLSSHAPPGCKSAQE
jgi:hypothetical protein